MLRNPRNEWKGSLEEYPLENYPDYEPGKPPRFEKLREIDYSDEMERVWGRRWGEQGIGRLREVALVKPTEHEVNHLFLKDPSFFMLRQPLLTGIMPNLEWMIQGVEDYAKALEENGVRVRWLEYDEIMGAYGPLRKLFVAANLGIVTNLGAIIPRFGHGSFLRGTEYYAQKFFTEMGCPVVSTVTGKGVFEGACQWPAENIRLAYYGIAINQEGLEQVAPIFRAAGVEMIMGHGTTIIDDFASGGDAHVDMALGVADLGVATVYPAQLDYSIYSYLKEHGYRFIEIPPDEQVKCVPSNGMILEPGKIIMSSDAKKTNAALRREGVDVIEIETKGIAQGGVNGIRCITLRLLRDAGPTIDEIKK